MSAPPPVDLESLVAECLSRVDVGGERVLDALCAEHPAHAAALRSAVSSLDGWGLGADAPGETTSRPRRLGDFEIRREIGRGGMGVVYEAEQISLRRTVALKVLPAHLTLRPAAIERFQREALTAARLKHPSIVDVIAVGTESDVHYFAMELVRGTPLDRHVERMRKERPALGTSDRSAVESVVRMVARVADALEHAHRSGVIHRDVKPSNVILRDDGTPVLTDFGLAREEGLPSITETGELAGTPHYIAPEQIVARGGKPDARTDVFALGVTLYELLTLERPFAGETRQEVFGAILKREPPDPRKFDRRLPADLATIVLKAIEKDPARRYASAGAMADDLRALLELRPIAAKRASAASRLSRWARREPAKAGLAAVLLAGVPALALLAGYLIAKRPEIRAAQDLARREEVEARIEEGFLLLEARRQERAIAAFDAARAIDPSCLEAIAGSALIDLNRGAPAEALALLSAIDPSLARESALERIRADALRAVGRDAEAADLERRFAPLQGATALLIESLREKYRADSTRDRKGYERALALITRSMATSPRARPIVFYVRAELARRTRNEAIARECAEALPQLWPRARMAWYWAGLSLAPFDPRAAAERYRRALELDPRFVDGHNALGAALMESSDAKGARDAFLRALELDPDFAKAHTNLGRALVSLGDAEGAREHFRRAVELDPKDAIAHSNYGVSLLESGDAPSAVESLRRSVEIDPTYSRGHNNLGRALLAVGDFEGAVGALRRSVELDPKYVLAHLNLADAYGRHGDWEQAAASYRQVLGLEPNNSTAKRELPRVLENAGNHEEPAETIR